MAGGDDREHGPDEVEDAGSLWEEMATQAVGPLVLELPDGDDIVSWTVDAPDSDGVCDLDELVQPLDAIAALLGGGDIADEVLDRLEVLAWSHTLDTVAAVRDHFALAVLPAGMWLDIVVQIDLYGEAIEADLALGGVGYTGGIDILDYFRGLRPWQQLVRLLGRLPEGSRYFAAVLDDEGLAAERVAAGLAPPAPRVRPPLLGETQDRMLLRAVVSALHRVEHATYAVHAKKGKAGKPPRPLPGPQTAEERVRDRLGTAEVEEMFDDLTPGWREGRRTAAPAGYSERPSGLLTPDT